jgi:hypothetical protein
MTPIIPDHQTSGAVMELNARIIAAAAVLADYRAEVASAPVSRPPGREWMLRLASVLEGLLAKLDDPAEDDDETDDLDGLEPYCAGCGAWAGIFYGLDGWRHYRGDPSPGGSRELYDAGHEAEVAWCPPPGRSISPADAAVLGQAIADAEAYRRKRAGDWCADCAGSPAEACDTHLDDLDQADAYAELGRQMQEGELQMEIDTGSFRALEQQVSDLEATIKEHRLMTMSWIVEIASDHARETITQVPRPKLPRSPRPRHLRSVGGES